MLSNVKAYVENKLVDCSLAVEQGGIFKIGKETNMPKASVKIDLPKLLVLPGLIDAHVHLRDEEKAHKEDFHSGTAAAAAGGFTTVLDMPNNQPVTMCPEAIRNRMKTAETKIVTNVAFYSEFPKNTSEIDGIVKAGAIAFKLFMSEQIGGLNIDDDQALLEGFKILSGLDVLIAVHAEDKAAIMAAKKRLKHNGHNSIDAFLVAHSEDVEVKAVRRILRVVKQAKARVHFCHVSTKKGLDMICSRKKSSKSVTCEATPHHLFLSVENLRKTGTTAIMTPPLREKPHVTALWNGVKNGCVDIVASDHAPHGLEEKNAKAIWDVKVGIPGLETTLPLLLTAVKKRQLSLLDVVRLMAERPAEIFGLRTKGFLREGNDADLTIVDLNKKHKIDVLFFKSKAKYSPFDGYDVIGGPVKTFVNGLLVMDDGEIVAKAGCGRVIRRQNSL